jgi:hypothetical protein
VDVHGPSLFRGASISGREVEAQSGREIETIGPG